MPVNAKLKYLRIAPRKVRLVADLIRGKSADEAQNILRLVVKKAAPPILKLLASAVSNAKNNFHLDEKNLYISKVLVDGGPMLKRWIARARGSANEIQKKTSHITLVLDELGRKSEKVKEGVEETAKKIEKEKVEKMEKTPKAEKAKLRPGTEIIKPQKTGRGVKKVLRRTAF